MKHCTQCGNSLSLRIPESDNRERHICNSCGHIHYVNPSIIVCALPYFEDQVLLCKRAIEPRYGFWTLPGGFMENDESSPEAAIRETMEEACARIELMNLYTFFNVVHINQVHLFFRARLLDLNFAAGSESMDVALFRYADIPWKELAFPAVKSTLQHYFQDLPKQHFPMRVADIIITENNNRIIRPHDFSHDRF